MAHLQLENTMKTIHIQLPAQSPPSYLTSALWSLCQTPGLSIAHRDWQIDDRLSLLWAFSGGEGALVCTAAKGCSAEENPTALPTAR